MKPQEYSLPYKNRRVTRHRARYLTSRRTRTDDVLRTVKLPIVLVPGWKRNLFSSLAAAQKGVKTIVEKNGSSLDLGPFGVQLTRFDNMDHLDLTIAKESRRTKSDLCAISKKPFGKESVVGRINL